jgi:hypothetical protein
MKKLLLIGALAFSLAGCVTAGQVTATVKQVQDAAAGICSFVPTATTVANIFASGNSTVQSVSSVASAICNAVTTRPLADGPGDRKPRVNGVVVRGRFIR